MNIDAQMKDILGPPDAHKINCAYRASHGKEFCTCSRRPSYDPFAPIDLINHPPHYASLNPEPIDVIESWGLGYHLGCAVKYIARAGKKDGAPIIKDLEKARWYLNREIERLKKIEEKGMR